MERYMNRIFVMAIGILLLSTLGCATTNFSTSSVVASRVDYVVKLRPDVGMDKLVPITPAQGWESGGKEDGYVGFDIDTFGDVLFVLDGEELGKIQCTTDASTTATWVITSIEITRFKHPQKEKGDKFGQNQRKNIFSKGWLLKSYPNASEDGVFFRKSKNQGKIFAAITNENNNNARKPELGWYRVGAMRCSDEEPLFTDPGIGNGGRR